MNTFKKTIEFDDEQADMRLDAALAACLPEYSRAQIQQWIKSGQVEYDDKSKLRSRDKVRSGQIVNIDAQLEGNEQWLPEPMDISVLYDDDDLIIVDKPVGLIVHPGAGAPSGTLINGLIAMYPELAHLPRCGLVHRIDKDTSGLLVIARSSLAHHSLTEQLQSRSMSREYQAIVKGTLIAGGTIDAPIGRHPKHRTKMAVHPTGRVAITHYRVLNRFQHYTHVSIKLESGRTHQIRVHFDSIHHPLIGDPAYGSNQKPPAPKTTELKGALKLFQRQALHAAELSLTHPRSNETMSWTSPLPQDMEDLLTALEHEQTLIDTK